MLAGLALVGCNEAKGDVVTLYRNSPFDPALRVQFATFSAAEKPPFNLNNCIMVSQIMNANVKALNEGEQRAGFWCESGEFREKGAIPTHFFARYPYD